MTNKLLRHKKKKLLRKGCVDFIATYIERTKLTIDSFNSGYYIVLDILCIHPLLTNRTAGYHGV